LWYSFSDVKMLQWRLLPCKGQCVNNLHLALGTSPSVSRLCRIWPPLFTLVPQMWDIGDIPLQGAATRTNKSSQQLELHVLSGCTCKLPNLGFHGISHCTARRLQRVHTAENETRYFYIVSREGWESRLYLNTACSIHCN